jgi:hypothetical protein
MSRSLGGSRWNSVDAKATHVFFLSAPSAGIHAVKQDEKSKKNRLSFRFHHV